MSDLDICATCMKPIISCTCGGIHPVIHADRRYDVWVTDGYVKSWKNVTDIEYCKDTCSFKTEDGKEVVVRGSFIVEEI